jgi:hypothetical protein
MLYKEQLQLLYRPLSSRKLTSSRFTQAEQNAT